LKEGSPCTSGEEGGGLQYLYEREKKRGAALSISRSPIAIAQREGRRDGKDIFLIFIN